MKNIDLVILAGGKGTRIKEFTGNKLNQWLNSITFIFYNI